MLDNEKFKALIGISENYEMPEKLMKILENQEDRETHIYDSGRSGNRYVI